MKRYKFSKELRSDADLAPAREYISVFEETTTQIEVLQQRLARLHKEFQDRMCIEHKFPRDLTPILDLNHLAEHGVVFLISNEAAEPADPEKQKETVH